MKYRTHVTMAVTSSQVIEAKDDVEAEEKAIEMLELAVCGLGVAVGSVEHVELEEMSDA